MNNWGENDNVLFIPGINISDRPVNDVILRWVFLLLEKTRRRSRNRTVVRLRRRLRFCVAARWLIRDPKVEEAPPSSH